MAIFDFISRLMGNKPSRPAVSAPRASLAYTGAAYNRMTQHLPSVTRGAFEELQYGVLRTIRARSRWLYNNTIAHGAINTIVRRVVGAGVQFYPELKSADGTYLREEALALRKAWSAHSRDISTRGHGFHQFSKLALLTYLRDGEAFLLPWENPGKAISREWQIIEGDQLAELDGLALENVAEGNKVEMGIEFNPSGRPAAYHFFDDGRDVFGGTIGRKIRRVPADRVIHWSNAARFDAPRGVPLLAAVVLLLSDEEEFRRAALTQAWANACLTAFITTNSIAATKNAFGDPSEMFNTSLASDSSLNSGLDGSPLAYGEIRVLDPDSKVDVVEPKAPSANFDGFDKAILRAIAVNLGISYIALMRDFEATNYSGGRQGDNEDRLTYQDISLAMDEAILEPIWREFTTFAYGVNRLLTRSKAEDSSSVYIQHPMPREVDPVKEQTAYEVALENGTISPQQVCARQGRNFHDISDQWLEARAYQTEQRVRGLADRERLIRAAAERAEAVNADFPKAGVDWREMLEEGERKNGIAIVNEAARAISGDEEEK